MGRILKDEASGKADENLSSSDALLQTSLAGEPWLESQQTQAVLQMLEDEGHGARVVGGAVRNALMGNQVRDIDVATTARPDEILKIAMDCGYSVHPTGIEHGTVTVVCENRPFEITTLRKDVATDGRRATVAFTDDWVEDASRRDFTINAIYCDRHGTLLDPIGGFDDIKNKRIRFIGKAEQRIREDYLRILRFFRFFATYGQDPIDASGLKACIENRDGLRSLSGERVRMELFQLLQAKRAGAAARLLVEHGLMADLIGETADIRQLIRLIEIEEYLGRDRDPVLRLAALAAQSSDDARGLIQKLKLSRAEGIRLKRIANISGRLDQGFSINEKASKIALYKFGPHAYVDLALIAWARSRDDVHDAGRIAMIHLPKKWAAPQLPVAGADIVALGVKPGRLVGLVLDRFEEWWIQTGFPEDARLIKDKLKSLVADL